MQLCHYCLYFPVIYICPNCLTEIRGFGRNDDSTATVEFNFENALIIGKSLVPDYYLSASREFPTALIKKYEETDEFALSPFMSFHHFAALVNTFLCAERGIIVCNIERHGIGIGFYNPGDNEQQRPKRNE